LPLVVVDVEPEVIEASLLPLLLTPPPPTEVVEVCLDDVDNDELLSFLP